MSHCDVSKSPPPLITKIPSLVSTDAARILPSHSGGHCVAPDHRIPSKQTWRVWGELGSNLTAQQWSRPTLCPGWDAACLYAHASMFPMAMSAPLPVLNGPVGEPLTAVEAMRRFNAPGGVATTMAKTIADAAVTNAAEHIRAQLIDRFTVQGSRALHGLRKTEPTMVVPWPAAEFVMTLVEAMRIVLVEATVHLLDVFLETAINVATVAPVTRLLLLQQWPPRRCNRHCDYSPADLIMSAVSIVIGV